MALYLCAVDVGTASARAGIFDETGRLLGRAEHPILMLRPLPDHAEYDGEDIWSAVSTATRGAVANAGVAPEEVVGLAFDATCSLVARDADGRPVSISTTGQNRWDTIAWLDHRAMREAEIATATGHPLLDTLGGVVSPEMQTPKAMWLKRHLPHSWARIALLFDLSDFLAWKATGSTERSLCTLATKWTFRADRPEGWSADYLTAIGLDDLPQRGALPERGVPPGTDLGGLSETAASDLGLTTAVRVGAGFVDAYAGALAVLGPSAADPDLLERSAALIAGTSSCVMVATRTPVRFAGCWGPALGTVFADRWTSEGGQSAAGALLDHLLRWHSAGGEPTGDLHARVVARIGELRALHGESFAERLHILPDFRGNRSPLADPRALGVISGLTMDTSFDDLCALYWRAAVSLALGIRHVLDALAAAGRRIDVLHVTGGQTRNPLLVELYADVTGRRVVTPVEEGAMLRGAAMAAACAAGVWPSLTDAAAAMADATCERSPDPDAERRYRVDYEIFLAMHEQRRHIDRLFDERLARVRRRGRFADRRLVVFDCDGVLVDSETIALDVLAGWIEAHGVSVDRDDLLRRSIGRSATQVHDELRAVWGVTVTAADAEELQDRLFERFRRELEPLPGIRRLLARLTVPRCVASSSAPRRLRLALATTGLLDEFEGRIFSATQVERGKPAPDLFLHAARAMGVDPRDCLVIEDSPAGIEAARRAGMAVIGFTGGGHVRSAHVRAAIAAAAPDAICESFDEIVSLLE